MPLDLPLVRSGRPGAEQSVGQDGETHVRRSVLPGGVRVLTEHMPGLRSATIGAWVGVGSRDEESGHHGSTHFLEHLLFKGTARRTAMDIAEAFDAVGGEANAATGKEHTCYYARVLDTDVPMAVDVIADMVTSARLDADELETERGVILEELAMNDDDPSDVVHEQFAAAVLGAHALGRPIGGTPETIRSVPREAVWEHYRWHYRPETLVVSAAGGIDHDAVCAMVADALERGGWDLTTDAVPAGRRVATAGVRPGEQGIPGEGVTTFVRRPTEQANVLVGGTSLTATDERRFALSVLNAVLGGGMSSRLFQEIREKRGLAYSTYSFASSHTDSGLFGLYAGCAPGKVDEVVALMVAEWERMASEPITQAELDRSIGQICGGLVLGMEDSGSRMTRLGKAELVHGELLSLDESLDRVRAVTAEQVQALAADLASRPRSVVRVGPGPRTT
ncbi:M16 family metallopeptidase [Cellulomonas composti]|uniref:Peptidase M16 n=1 Tax=Cellulomonas composti TaxID=266130 RepID=A0A511J8K2_9CELL|nr:pitrilysin family protein [Cellulomonas composti]GEL94318.1 peptidase M16 [Cellulomonas composti]